jgi:hypothetical protein
MKEKANEIANKVNRWNVQCSQSHDVYLGEITNVAFDGEYDCTKEGNRISDYEKLSKIWKAVNNENYTNAELVEKTKEIIYI